MRNVLALMAAGLLLAALPPEWPAAQDGEPEPPAEAQAGEEQDQQDSSSKGEAEPAQEESAAEDAEDAGESAGPRRLPPRTDEEERRYKLAKAQNDPFLLDQMSGEVRADPGEFYDPLESVLPVAVSDLSRYIVQDSVGVVLGHLEIGVKLEPGGGLFRLEIMNELSPPTQITVIARADDLDALSTERKLLRLGLAGPAAQPGEPGPDMSPLQEPPRTSAEYNYDRIVVKLEQGGVVSQARLRELPFSFDRDLLPLLIRRIDYQNIAWPFEAVATDTARLASLPLALDKPERVEVLSAEPESYYCFKSELRVGAEVSVWWVEQVPPHRLVKFTMDGLTYTLERYMRQ